jgi:hypothetical protein
MLFGSGIANRRALYTRASMDEDRRRTLLELIELADDSTPAACWDDAQAMRLLRNNATADELRELGASEGLIEQVYADVHE